jgi:Zinc dependent phospholipase C
VTNPRRPARIAFFLLIAFLCTDCPRGSAYSVLTHQAIIDLAWQGSIRPLLLARYPRTTEDQLTEAHAYAYGGCAIQDAGYYPFGNRFFSDLTHYVRSGDFITSLLRNAHNVNEYAFALGALSHYLGDSIGHAEAINPAVALAYPKFAQKYGSIVTYEQEPRAYVATEFSFDIAEDAHNRFAPDAYLHALGLHVPRALLERAFFETYGLKLTAVLGKTTRAAIHSYRSSIRSFIPTFAKAEVVLHRGDLPRTDETPDFQLFERHRERVPYLPAWAHSYRGPDFGEHILAGLIKILPPIGAIDYLKIRVPTTDTEQMYFRSLNRTLLAYSNALDHLRLVPPALFHLPNRDLDTGDWTRPGAYALTDQTYAHLLHAIVSKPENLVPAGLKQDILDYYSVPDAPITTRHNHRKWARVQQELIELRQREPVDATQAVLLSSASDPD